MLYGQTKTFLIARIAGRIVFRASVAAECVRVAHRSRVASDASLTMAFYKCCARVMDEWEIKV